MVKMEGAMLVAMSSGGPQSHTDLQRLFGAGGDNRRRYAGGNE